MPLKEETYLEIYRTEPPMLKFKRDYVSTCDPSAYSRAMAWKRAPQLQDRRGESQRKEHFAVAFQAA